RRDGRLRARRRLPRRRLPRLRAARPPLRRPARRDPQRDRPRHRGRRHRAPRPVRQRLDQARPVGLIGATKSDALETIGSLLEDIESGALPSAPVREADAVLDLLDDRGVQYTTWDGWTA